MPKIVAVLAIAALCLVGTATASPAKKDHDDDLHRDKESQTTLGNDQDDHRVSLRLNSVGGPEPSTLYAVSSGLLLVGAAGWLLRRNR